MQVGSIHPEPTIEEVAAITAAIGAIHHEQRARAVAGAPSDDPGRLSVWLLTSRRSAQRSPLQRGPWRLSGRIGRRFRT